MAKSKRAKKWFMLQLWRLQQVAQLLTLVLLALNLALQVFGLIKWREDSPLSTSYIGVPLILLFLAMIIWTFAIIWDLRLKMWRDQAAVLVERNPYTKEKMMSKEVVVMSLVYLPLMEKLGQNDPEINKSLGQMKGWLRRACAEDAVLMRDVKDIIKYLGRDELDILGPEKK